MGMRLWSEQTFFVLFSISRRKGDGRRWRGSWPSKIDSNLGKHCCCCWFGQKWLSNRIKNDSRIFEHPKDSSPSDSERGFGKEKIVCIESHLAKTLSQCPKQTDFFKQNYETWCFAYDPETKQRNFEWVGETSSRPKKVKFQMSDIKTMLKILFSTLKAQCTKNSYRRKKQ